MSSRIGPFDLLRERRRDGGSLETGGPLIPASRLLLRGSALGGGTLALMLLVLGALSWQEKQLDAAVSDFSLVRAETQALEAQIGRVRRSTTELQRSSDGLAKGLVGVSSGSALIAELSAATPAGVQLTEMRSQGNGLVLKGVAVDPEAFRRVNGLSLLLSQSRMFDSESVQVVKVQRDGSLDGPVQWEISARFASLPSEEQLELLQALKADGLLRRLRLLQNKGVVR